MIYLLGYMGSGKTTFGRALASACGKTFVDLDDYIEEIKRKKIREIFRDTGEEGFRRIERESLRQLSETDVDIIACGGGTPCFFDNMEFMNSKGYTVWLNASQERLFERLRLENSTRPLIAGLNDENIRQRISADLKKRTPFYEAAQIHLDADRLDSAEEISRTLRDFIAQYPALGFAFTKGLH